MHKSFFNNLSRRQKLTFILLIFAVIVTICYAIFTLIQRAGKIRATVYYAPSTTIITLNGTPVRNNTKIYLQPGTYQVEASADHFKSEQQTLTIDADNNYIVGSLEAADEEGQNYAAAHDVEFIIAQGYVSFVLNREGERNINHYPILKYLPINNSVYSISYAQENLDSAPILSVKASRDNLNVAVFRLKSFTDVTLEDYQINFSGDNPFQTYQDPIAPSPEDCLKRSIPNLANFRTTDAQYLGDQYYYVALYSYNEQYWLDYAHYRALFKKVDGGWQIAGLPQPLLTRENTPDVPLEILQRANAFNYD